MQSCSACKRYVKIAAIVCPFCAALGILSACNPSGGRDAHPDPTTIMQPYGAPPLPPPTSFPDAAEVITVTDAGAMVDAARPAPDAGRPPDVQKADAGKKDAGQAPASAYGGPPLGNGPRP